MRRLLIGVDESIEGGNALRWAARLAAELGTDLTVVSAVLPPFEPPTPEDAERHRDELAAKLDRLWARSARSYDVDARTEVVDGDPRQALLEVAARTDADLVVVGQVGGEGEDPGFLHLGSVAEYLAHHTDRPLAVIPHDGPSRPPGRVVVGVDGSTESGAAVDWAAALTEQAGGELLAVNVQSPSAERGAADTPDDWLHFLVEGQIPQWTRPATDRGVEATPVAVRARRPAEGLLRAAADHEADLLVVGARGTGGFAGLRLGGTALATLHRADLPLALVP